MSPSAMATAPTSPDVSIPSIFIVFLSLFCHCDKPVVKSHLQVLLNDYLSIVLRQNLLDKICPLDKADAVAIEVVFIADLIHLADIADPVHVKVVKGKPALVVNLQYRKSRAADRPGDPESPGNSLGKNSFADAKIAYKCIDRTRLRAFTNSFSNFKCFLG